MGSTNNHSLISAHFCISAYFLTAETYKCMRLTTRVYGIVSQCLGCILLIDLQVLYVTIGKNLCHSHIVMQLDFRYESFQKL